MTEAELSSDFCGGCLNHQHCLELGCVGEGVDATKRFEKNLHATSCPTCGHLLDRESKLYINENAREVSSNGQTILMSRTFIKILSCLKDHSPHFVSYDTLQNVVHDYREVYVTDGVIRTHVSRINKLLAPLGVHIEGRRECGYRLGV